MEDTAKYLIRADVTADGVVERSDVVGAIFGQTEGLLGDELDLRELRQSGKVGRIDVEVSSTAGQSHGHVTIATGLDKIETATLAASLETIAQVGPCRADLEITEIEDVRAAKRKAVVDRAKELLETGFDDSIMSSEEILAEVRQHVRVEDATEYEGLPAGPRVTDSDAIIIVEGRADVLALLKVGVKNAIAVEGTNVPDAVAELTTDRTVTAFLDGDRGGDLILEELAQIGDVDYVAFAPAETSVEDLDRHKLFTALRNKVPYDAVAGSSAPREAVAATDGSATPAPSPDAPGDADPAADPAATDDGANQTPEPAAPNAASTAGDHSDPDAGSPAATEATAGPETVYDHATAVVREGSSTVRVLANGDEIAEAPAEDAYETLSGLDLDAEDAPAPSTVVLDDALDQRLLDLAADLGVDRIIARDLEGFTKRPTDVQIHAIDDVAETAPGS